MIQRSHEGSRAEVTKRTTLAAGHVTFELKALVDDAELLLDIDRPLAANLSIPILEAMLLHLRNLIEFLFNNSPSERAIAAIDYCPTWKSQDAVAFHRIPKVGAGRST